MLVAYDGTAFAGFQSQTNGRAVQDELEAGLLRLYGVRPRVRGAGRTDAGVHAVGQVASFDLADPGLARRIPVERLGPALDSVLADDVRVLGARAASSEFDPRRAREKTYRYRLLVRNAPCPLRRRTAWHIERALDVGAMRVAAKALTGRHDFAAFAGSGGDRRSTVRTLRALRIAAVGADEVHIDLTADGFLYHMARTLVGTLVECGLGRREPTTMAALVAGGRRHDAGVTAPAHGLCLLEVRYEPSLEGPWLRRKAGWPPDR
jgi:tRNA pseudouridine38-40 synthase